MSTRGSWRSRHPILANILATVIAAGLIGFGTYGVVRGYNRLHEIKSAGTGCSGSRLVSSCQHRIGI